MNDELFLGTGWSFPPYFDNNTSGLQMVSGEEDIRQSLRILFGTLTGERMMLPKYGCNLREFLFENIDTTTETYLRELITNAILFYEPRITVNSLSFDDSQSNEGLIMLQLDYTVRSVNSRNNIVYPFYLNEGTLVDIRIQ